MRLPLAVIFSFENVLIDLTTVSHQAMEDSLDLFGFRWVSKEEYRSQYSELGPAQQLEKLSVFIPKIVGQEEEILNKYAQIYFPRHTQSLSIDPSRSRILKYLSARHIKMGVSSDYPCKCIFELLSKFEWMQYMSSYSFYPLAPPKPDPQGYYMLAEEMGVKLRDTAIVEGSLLGAEAESRVETFASINIPSYNSLTLEILLHYLKRKI